MIHVDREQRDEDSLPIRPDKGWFDRARLATEEVKGLATRLLDAEEPTDPPLAELAFEADRELYADDEVKKALRALFHGKCAYCESEVVALTHLEVEHFRPKGRVVERPEHPGYYWLAYDWRNLYLSCKLCNGRYRDQPTRDEPTVGEAKGKYDQFPVFDEAARAMSHRQAASREAPKLLDPCRDRPVEVLTFGLDGRAIAIGEDRKAETSIEVLHLDRRGLRAARSKRIAEVLEVMKLFLGSGRMDLARQATRVYSKPSSLYSAACEAIWRNPTAFGLPDVELSNS